MQCMFSQCSAPGGSRQQNRCIPCVEYARPPARPQHPCSSRAGAANLPSRSPNISPTTHAPSVLPNYPPPPARVPPGPLPAVLAPHGGPHTAVTLGWYPPYAFLAALGYAVLCPNYRGSTGYGQEALGSLPGRVGRQDVADCVAAVRAAADAGGWWRLGGCGHA